VKNSLLFLTLLFLLATAPAAVLHAQEGDAKAIALRPVSEEQWARATRELDYSKDVPQEEKPRPERSADLPDYTANTQWLGQILQVLAIILLAGLVVFGLYRMLRQPRNRRISKEGVEITLDNIEEHIHETDLERFLREALQQQNYSLAIRLYYLQLIKNLSSKNLLRWSREKTNRDYLREMEHHRLYDPFRSATRVFERVWYGNTPIDAGEYARLEPQFKSLLAQI
jgi:hypothetical protein